MKKRLLLVFIALLTLTQPLRADREGEALFSLERGAILARADAVAGAALADAHLGIRTGSAHFDGEWQLVSCQMTTLALVRVVERFPDTREDYLPAIRHCGVFLMSPEARAFGTEVWGEDGLGGDGAHIYLGYIAGALGAWRRLEEGPHSDVHEALIGPLRGALAGELNHAETFPGVVWPADIAVAASAVAQHAAWTGAAWDIADFEARYRELSVDTETGLLWQVRSPSGAVLDEARGSTTAFAEAFLSPRHPRLRGPLNAAVCSLDDAAGPWLGVREYPHGRFGLGDMDSGPLIFGRSLSATAFALAGARARGQQDRYVGIWRTARLTGAPIRRHGGRWLQVAGTMGNAILLAMTMGVDEDVEPGTNPSPRPR